MNNGRSLFQLYVAAQAVAWIGNLVIRIGVRGGWLPPAAQILLAIGAAVPFAVAAVVFWRLLRSDLDEMFQRVVLEGLAFALVTYVPLAALYVNLKVGEVWAPRLGAPEILMMPALLVTVGIFVARRRYE